MSDQKGPQTDAAVKGHGEFSPWWFRFGLPIVGIDIFIQALLIWGWATTQPPDLGIGFATFFALFIIIPGNLIAFMLTPMAVSNLRLKGEGRVTVILCLAVWTGPLVALYDSRPSSVNAERGEWRTVTPGKPLAKFPTVRVIEEGKGPVVEVGNLVKVHLRYHVTDPDKWIDNGDWWIWTGFYVSKVETPLYTVSPRIASALIGLREGSLFDIVDAHDVPNTEGRVADSLFTAMLSPTMGKYEILKHINGTIEHNTTIFVSSPSKPGTELRILTTCKAEMQVRTVRLWDDSRVRMQSGNPDREGGMREVSVEETRVQGKCTDGHTATFSHGPERLVTKDGRYPDYSGWVKVEWEKLPVGVQVK